MSVACGLASCVGSHDPLLTAGEPTMGPHFTAQLYRNFKMGRADDLRTVAFTWKDGTYVKDGPDTTTATRFVTRPLQGDDSIVQTSDTAGKLFTYWIARKLIDGAYLFIPLDEADIDPASRAGFCAAGQPQDFCIIKTSEQLFVMARATAGKPVKNGEIGIVVPEGFGGVSGAAMTR